MSRLIAGGLLRPRAPLPTHWTGELVRERIVEAFAVELRLPLKNGNGSNGWPFAVVHEFSEMVGWDDARERVWAHWRRARGAFPYEVSRMEEAFGWMAVLKEHRAERWCLASWSLLTAKRHSVRRMLASRKSVSRATYYRKVEAGARRIADALNAQGVRVR